MGGGQEQRNVVITVDGGKADCLDSGTKGLKVQSSEGSKITKAVGGVACMCERNCGKGKGENANVVPSLGRGTIARQARMIRDMVTKVGCGQEQRDVVTVRVVSGPVLRDFSRNT